MVKWTKKKRTKTTIGLLRSRRKKLIPGVILTRPRNAEENHASYVIEDQALIAEHGDVFTKCSAKVADVSTVDKLATVLERGQINTLMTGRVRTPVVHYTGTRNYSTMENSFQYQ